MHIIEQIYSDFLLELSDIDVCAYGLTEGLAMAQARYQEFILKFFQAQIEEIDRTLLADPNLRPGWVATRKDVRIVETISGTLHFTRRYYRHRQTGEFCHLTDVLTGIVKHDRIDRGLKAAVCNLVSEYSYRQAAEISSEGRISKQAVMRISREVDIPRLEPVARDPVPVLHIQADEDHVATQDKRRSQELRLAVIHEPIQRRGKKAFLPHKHHVLAHSFNEPPEQFWGRVYDAIIARYGEEPKRIYLHGDAAAWIKSGLEWLPNSRFVLDHFHVAKYLTRLAPHDSEAYQGMLNCLLERKKKEFESQAQAAAAQYGKDPERSRQAMNYILNNWRGIAIWTLDPDCGRSCAEGLVSHCLSARFSSRPMAWLDEGAGDIAGLREHSLNKGKIIWQNFPAGDEQETISTVESVKLNPLRDKLEAEKSRELLPMPTIKLARAKLDAHYRIFKSITEGGMGRFG